MKAKKKPIPVNVWQLPSIECDYDTPKDLLDTLSVNIADRISYKTYNGSIYNGTQYIIKSLEGDMTAVSGDYLVQGSHDDIWVVEQHIFEDTYDIISDKDVYKELYDYIKNNDVSLDEGDEWYTIDYTDIAVDEYKGKDTIVHYSYQYESRGIFNEDLSEYKTEESTLEELINFITKRKFGNKNVEFNWNKAIESSGLGDVLDIGFEYINRHFDD